MEELLPHWVPMHRQEVRVRRIPVLSTASRSLWLNMLGSRLFCSSLPMLIMVTVPSSWTMFRLYVEMSWWIWNTPSQRTLRDHSRPPAGNPLKMRPTNGHKVRPRTILNQVHSARLAVLTVESIWYCLNLPLQMTIMPIQKLNSHSGRLIMMAKSMIIM